MHQDKDIAIIGWAGRFPEAETIGDFLHNLVEGRNSVRKLSAERIIQTTIDRDKEYQKIGFLDHVDRFDHRFFGISKAEADFMNPNHRLILETACHAFEDACLDYTRLKDLRVGVLLGAPPMTYHQHADAFHPSLFTGNIQATMAGRLSRFFDLRGGAAMIDTACSSALVALHYAVRDLQSGDADLMIVGGSEVECFPQPVNGPMGDMNIFSPEGKTKTFSEGASGTAPGEAVICLILKPKSKAIADGDRIHAVIRGSAINQDAARSASFSAPDSNAQAEVLKAAWEKAGVNPEEITYIECHGTGTAIGDPIEVRGIDLAFSQYTGKKHFCAVSSVKTNIGHTNSAAGLAGLVKAVLSIKTGLLFPSINFDEPNSLIGFQRSAVFVNDRLRNWDDICGGQRLAGVSSFGISGTNCHVVLAPAPEAKVQQDTAGKHLVCLSVHDDKLMPEFRRRLIRSLVKTGENDLGAVAYTLNKGRRLMPVQELYACSSVADFMQQLENAAGIRLPREKRPVWFFFADPSPEDSQLLTALLPQFAVFRNLQEEVRRTSAGVDPESENSFVLQLGMVRLLQSLGVPADHVAGTGKGKHISAFLSGKQSLSDSVRLYSDETAAPDPVTLENGFDRFFKAKATEGALTIILAGNETITRQALHQRAIDYPKNKLAFWNETADHPLGEILFGCFCSGFPIDWSKFYEDRHYRIADLPGTVFEPVSCWIKTPEQYFGSYIPDWLYGFGWQELPAIETAAWQPENDLMLVFGQLETETGREISKRLCRRNQLITVDYADTFEQTGKHSFRLRRGNTDDLRKVFLSLEEWRDKITALLLLDGITVDERAAEDAWKQDASQTMHWQHAILRTFHAVLKNPQLKLIQLTANAFRLGSEEYVPARNPLHQLLKTAMTEYPGLQALSLDMDKEDAAVTIADTLMKETEAADFYSIRAIRNGKRFVQELVPVHPGTGGDQHKIRLKHRGVYLMTGGTGGVALAVADELASEFQPILLINGRKSLPAPDQWKGIQPGEKHYEIISRLLALEDKGATVRYFQADISDRSSAASLAAEIQKHYSRIDGIFHLAGAAGSFRNFHRTQKQDIHAAALAKVDGIRNLAGEFGRLAPDFLVAFSSLITLIPSRRSLDYVLSNAWLDSLAQVAHPDIPRVKIFNWGAWENTGMMEGVKPGENEVIRSYWKQEAYQALKLALVSAENRVAVAHLDKSQIASNPFFAIGGKEQSMAAAPDPEAASLSVFPDDWTDAERKIGAAWKRLLRRDNVSLHDNFFESGGHSLIGTQLLNYIRKQFGKSISLKQLYAHPTLSALARLAEGDHKQKNQDIPLAPVRQEYPISAAQFRIWLLTQSIGSSLPYTIPQAFELNGEVDENLLQQAYSGVIARHESLRTVFRSAQDGQVVQVILGTEHPSELEFADHSASANADEELERLADALFRHEFDLENGPLIKAMLIRLPENRHCFILFLHHIISDGWSIEVLMKEILDLYAAGFRGQKNTIPALRIQYKDFTAWMDERLKKGELNASRSFWMQALAGELPKLDIPFSRPRPQLKTYVGASADFRIGAPELVALRSLMKEEGGSLFTGLVASLQSYFYRITGQDDIVFGSPIAGRNHADLEHLIGFFINTVALRNRFTENDTLRSVFRKVNGTVLDAYEHQDYPFDQLVNDLGITPDPSRSPVFDCIVGLQNFAGRHTFDSSALGFTVKPIQRDRKVCRLDLSFLFFEAGDDLLLNVEYNTDLYASGSIDQLVAGFRHFLTAVAAQPDTRLAAADILTVEEREKLLRFGERNSVYPREKGIAALFEEQAVQYPLQTALISGEREFTYRELNKTANRMASWLRKKQGVKKGETVATLLEPGYPVIVSILGILKAGGIYVPVDPGYPLERQEQMLRDSGAAFTVSDASFHEFLRDSNDYSDRNPGVKAGGESPAYIMYTSGSTGKPKGAVIPHRAVIRLVRNTDYVRFGSDIRILSTGSVSFDATTFEYWGALLNGGTLVMRKRSDLLDPATLRKVMTAAQVNMLWLTAGLFNQLAENDPAVFAGLHTLVAGGDRLSAHHLGLVLSMYPELRIVNGYGPTENTTFSICGDIVAAELPLVTLGQPVCNTSVYIFNSSLQLQPEAVPGEIYLGGDGLALGYHLQPELTKERFIPHPFREGERLYKTGDLGRWLPDGRVEFLGRIDDQVKIRGYRVEPGEVEFALQQLPLVRSVAVKVVELAGRKSLAAYYVAERELRADALREQLGRLLPEYMVPDYFVAMEELPLTANGKVNRKALPEAILPATVASAKKMIAPSSALERKLAAIWEKILGISGISADDDFLELGGHSLRTMALAAELRKEFQVDVRYADLFRNTGFQAQARLIEHSAAAVFTPIPVLTQEAEYALSPSQRRIFILSKFEGGNTAYNVYGCFRLTGPVDKDKLQGAIQQVSDRHESLRTVFATGSNGQPVQRIRPAGTVQIPLEFVSSSPESHRRGETDALIQQFAGHEFDLSTGPLLRNLLVRIDADAYIFVFVIHHIVSDGWSVEMLMQEVLRYYESGDGFAPDPLPLQYKDYAAWINSRLAGKEGEKLRAYWLGTMSGELPVLDLPAARPRLAFQDFAGHTRHYTLAPALADALQQIARKQQGTLFTAFATVVSILLNRYTGAEDMILGTPVAAREHPDLKQLSGMFVNTLPLRFRFDSHVSVNDLGATIRQTALEAFEHQAYPFEQLIEDLGLQRDMSRSALFDVMISVLNRDIGGFHQSDNNGFQAEQYPVSRPVSHFDLTLTLTETNGGLVLSSEYSTALFDTGFIDRMSEHLFAIIREAAADGEKPIHRIDYLSDDERDTLIRQLNPEFMPYDRETTIAAMFEAQVAKTPDAIALVSGAARLTYSELNNRAGQMANFLVQHSKTGRGDVAVIALPRGVQLMTAILACLKSGIVYVPLDPALPAERRSYMERMAAPSVLVDTAWMTAFETAGKLPEERLYSPPRPDDTAYVIFTSGSTGEPKGVKVSHRSLVNISNGWIHAYRLDSFSICSLQLAAVSFDVFAGDYCRTLLTGGKLVITDEEERLDFVRLHELVVAHGVNYIEATPALLLPMIGFWLSSGRNPGGIRLLVTGGEAIGSSEFEKLSHQLREKGIRFINSYGITEVTIDSCFFELVPGKELSAGNAPIGRPFANNHFYVLDKNMNLLPRLATGELFIGGENLAEGYWNNPELTREKYVPNPFRPGERMYKTGDSARWNNDGDIEFFGRTDLQLKLRGYRIETGDIENAICRHTAVAEAVAAPYTAANGRVTDLTLYLVLHQPADPKSLHEFLSAQLPPYMIPGYWVITDAIPKTPNGKYDRRHLPVPTEENRLFRTDYEVPGTETEHILAALFARVLGRDDIGVRHHFFESGGQSILAIELMNRINGAFGISITLRDIFTHPVLGELAQLIDRCQPEDAPVIVAGDATAEYPLTPGQEMIWLFQQLYPQAASAYNMPSSYRIQHDFNLAEFEAAVHDLVQRHASLRTVFSQKAGRPVQLIQPEMKGVFSLADHRMKEDPFRSALQLAEDIAAAPMDLSSGPLAKIQLIRMTESGYILSACFHHIICDGWSEEIIVRDLLELYSSRIESRRAELPEMRVQFADYARWLETYEQRPQMEKHRHFWKSVFSGGIPRVQLPVDFTAGGPRSFAGKLFAGKIGADAVNAATKLAAENNASLFTVLLTTLQLTISRWTGQQEMVIGTPVAGRILPELLPQVGYLMNVIPVVAVLQPEKSFETLLAETRDFFLEAVSHQLFRFEKELNDGQVKAEPLFHVICNLNNTELSGPEKSPHRLSFTAEHILVEPANSKFDLTCNFHLNAQNELELYWIYSTDLFRQETILVLMEKFKGMLQGVLEEPKKPWKEIHDLPALKEDDEELDFSFNINID